MPNSQGQVQKEKGHGPLASQVLLSLKKTHLAWQHVTSKAMGATEERGLPLQEREQRATKLFPLTLLGCWVDPPGGVVRLSEEDPQWEGLGWLSEGQGLQSCTRSWLAAVLEATKIQGRMWDIALVGLSEWRCPLCILLTMENYRWLTCFTFLWWNVTWKLLPSRDGTLTLNWFCDLIWPIEYGRSDGGQFWV